jgi:hypothetical protein
MVEGAVLCGYNIRRFDTLLLDAELRRAGKRGLPRDDNGKIATPEVDLYQLWVRHEARTLAGAAARFAGVTMGDEAHSASADTDVLPHMLEGMCQAFGLDPNNLDALARLSVPDGCVDRDGKFTRREDGVVVFNFGQSKGQPVASNRSFLTWMLGKDFSEETKSYARAFLTGGRDDRAVNRDGGGARGRGALPRPLARRAHRRREADVRADREERPRGGGVPRHGRPLRPRSGAGRGVAGRDQGEAPGDDRPGRHAQGRAP